MFVIVSISYVNKSMIICIKSKISNQMINRSTRIRAHCIFNEILSTSLPHSLRIFNTQSILRYLKSYIYNNKIMQSYHDRTVYINLFQPNQKIVLSTSILIPYQHDMKYISYSIKDKIITFNINITDFIKKKKYSKSQMNKIGTKQTSNLPNKLKTIINDGITLLIFILLLDKDKR